MTYRETTADGLIIANLQLSRDSLVFLEPVPVLSLCCQVQLRGLPSEEGWGGRCPQCRREYDAEEIREQLFRLETIDGLFEEAADLLAARMFALACGDVVPSPFGVPIDMPDWSSPAAPVAEVA